MVIADAANDAVNDIADNAAEGLGDLWLLGIGLFVALIILLVLLVSGFGIFLNNKKHPRPKNRTWLWGTLFAILVSLIVAVFIAWQRISSFFN